jgi:predicted  nucleic acid-binding Zn-ribbon protein
MDTRQHVNSLETQLQQSQVHCDQVEKALDSYKIRYQQSVDQFNNLQEKFSQVQENLVQSRAAVSVAMTSVRSN